MSLQTARKLTKHIDSAQKLKSGRSLQPEQNKAEVSDWRWQRSPTLAMNLCVGHSEPGTFMATKLPELLKEWQHTLYARIPAVRWLVARSAATWRPYMGFSWAPIWVWILYLGFKPGNSVSRLGFRSFICKLVDREWMLTSSFWVDSCGGPGPEVGLACLILHATQAAPTSKIEPRRRGRRTRIGRLPPPRTICSHWIGSGFVSCG